MIPLTIALPLDEYRRQVARLLVWASECGADEAGIAAATKLRRRAANLQTIITQYGE
jgi:hypothetical protein